MRPVPGLPAHLGAIRPTANLAQVSARFCAKRLCAVTGSIGLKIERGLICKDGTEMIAADHALLLVTPWA